MRRQSVFRALDLPVPALPTSPSSRLEAECPPMEIVIEAGECLRPRPSNGPLELSALLDNASSFPTESRAKGPQHRIAER